MMVMQADAIADDAPAVDQDEVRNLRVRLREAEEQRAEAQTALEKATATAEQLEQAQAAAAALQTRCDNFEKLLGKVDYPVEWRHFLNGVATGRGEPLPYAPEADEANYPKV